MNEILTVSFWLLRVAMDSNELVELGLYKLYSHIVQLLTVEGVM